jgi:hypothetical protein
MKIELSRKIFAKYSNIKIYESMFSEIQVVPCGTTEARAYRQTDGKRGGQT